MQSDHRQLAITITRDNNPDIKIVASHLLSGEHPTFTERYFKQLQVRAAAQNLAEASEETIALNLFRKVVCSVNLSIHYKKKELKF